MGTEVGHAIATGGDSYGKKGDNNWQQVALCEGWANYIEYKMPYKYLKYYDTDNGFPEEYWQMYNSLQIIGCSLPDMEKCLTEKTIIGYRDQLINIYPSLKDKISTIIKKYE